MLYDAQDTDAAWNLILQAAHHCPENTETRHCSLAEGSEGSEVRQLLDTFLPLCRNPAAFSNRRVIGQMGQSLDGRIATVTGASRYINGEDGLRHLHRLRAICDAVVIGAGTATEDNPRLTVRMARGPNPVRVVIDRHKRVPEGHHLFSDRQAPTLRLVAGNHIPGARQLPTAGVLEVPCLTSAKQTMPQSILQVLGDFGLQRLFIEGGGRTVSSFLSAGLLDHLHVMVAPMIIGSGRPAFSLPEIEKLNDALRPSSRMVNLGSDMLFDLDFNLPHQQAF